MIVNSREKYGHLAKILHWLMAIVFVAMFFIAYVMTNIDKSHFRDSLYDFHKATGILLFMLAIVRLTWRALNVSPALPSAMRVWQQQAAKWNVIFLYAVMIIMPISGFLTSTLGGHPITFYGLITLAPLSHNAVASQFYSDVHEIVSYVFIGLFSLHVLGSLYHHYCLKDGLLKKMWL